MSTVNSKYLKDENGEVISPIVSIESVYNKDGTSFEDTGWIELTLNSEISKSTTGYGGLAGCWYRKIGDHVFVEGSVSMAWNGTSSMAIATVPYKPQALNYSVCVCTGYCIVREIIGTGGVVYVEWVRSLSNAAAITDTLNWVQIKIDYWVK